MKRSAALLPFLLMLWLLPGVCQGAKEESYFPLKPGMTWEYRVISDKRETKKLVVTNLPPQEISGKTGTPRKFDSEGGTRIIYVAQDDSGVYRFAEQASEKGEPTMVKPPVYYLKYPIHLGESWDISTELGKSGIMMKVTLRIDGVDDTVKVPAGTFKNCLKIKHSGGNVPGGENDPTIKVEAYEWLAPGVGWVKSMMILKKKVKGEAETSESLNYQLESFKK